MQQFQIISVFPPREPGGKALAYAEVILTKGGYMKAEDYNSETKKSYPQAEGMVQAGFKFRCTVIADGKGVPMIVGSILPPFEVGRAIARDAVAQLVQRDSDAA